MGGESWEQIEPPIERIELAGAVQSPDEQRRLRRSAASASHTLGDQSRGFGVLGLGPVAVARARCARVVRLLLRVSAGEASCVSRGHENYGSGEPTDVVALMLSANDSVLFV